MKDQSPMHQVSQRDFKITTPLSGHESSLCARPLAIHGRLFNGKKIINTTCFNKKNVHDDDTDRNNRLLKMTSFIKFTKVINCNICRECNWYSEISDDCNIALELCAY